MKTKLTSSIICLVCFMFTSCMATYDAYKVNVSTHSGVTYVQKPDMKEQDQQKWYAYYTDQLDAYEGNVIAPNEQYPESAKQGFFRAKKERDEKIEKTTASRINQQSNKYLIFSIVGVGLLLLPTFLLVL